MINAVRSPEEVKAWFEANGLSISDWAQSRGFSRAAVYAALGGRTRGRRGEAYVVALALGLKAPPPIDLAAPPGDTHGMVARTLTPSQERTPDDELTT